MTTYLISRTSAWGSPDDEEEENRTPPVSEAFAIVRQSWDRRSFKSEAEHDERFPGTPWRSQGTEHQTYEGGIMRRWPDRRVWAVEAESVEDLLRSYGTLVVTQEWHGPNEPEMIGVEVYDGYRE